MTEPIVFVENLVRRFGRRPGDTTAVNNLSLSIQPGEIYGLVGPDGAGKTTTFRLLVGALHPDSGRGTIAGYDLLRDIERAREQLGYLPQRFSLYGDLTVAENLRFFAEVRGLTGPAFDHRAQELLSFVGLDGFE